MFIKQTIKTNNLKYGFDQNSKKMGSSSTLVGDRNDE